MHSLRTLIDLCNAMEPQHVNGVERPGAVAALDRALRLAHRKGIKFDYNSIDRIMQLICHRYHLTGDRLHNLFVKQHGIVPDQWVKQF